MKKLPPQLPLPSQSILQKANENKSDHDYLPQIFPRNLPRPPEGSFLRNESPYEDSFMEALRGPYEGFIIDNSKALMSSSENSPIEESTIQSSLERMKCDGYFRTDVTQPFGLGTKCAKTYVTRCVVGDPGTTYKYLGLRMFAHPWDNFSSSSQVSRKVKKRKLGKQSVGDPRFEKDTHHPGDNHRNVFADTSTIRGLGHALTKRTAKHLRDLDESRLRRRAPSTKGRPDFDICLINRMESSPDLKPFVFGGGNRNSKIKKGDNNTGGTKTSVSWHADSSLEHYSTIAVYQTLLGGTRTQQTAQSEDKIKRKNSIKKENTEKGQWWVALRVAHHSEGPQASQKRKGTNTEASIVEETPPIAVTLPSGSAYYLLDDFNHHHQHTVLTTGDATSAGIRYSCTFRLLRDSHNVNDWINRGKATIRQFHKKGPKIWRSEQLLLTEIESEWIRQFYIQGRGNKDLLWEPYWKSAIEELLSIWSQLEYRTKQTMDLLRAAAEGMCCFDTVVNSKNGGGKAIDRKPSNAHRKSRDRRKKSLEKVLELISRAGGSHNNMQNKMTGEAAYRELYEPFAELLDERARMRELWEKREKDHVFRDLPHDCRPMKVPFKYEQELVSNVTDGAGSRCFGMSPLPECPLKLREMSKQLRQCGEAFREGDISLLPPPWKSNKPKSDFTNKEESDESCHRMPMDWSGWNSDDQVFGLELQHPWAGAVVDGKKSIETRAYALPPCLVGKKVMIIQSPSGQAGISKLGNRIELSCTQKAVGARIIGWCTFSSIKEYTTKKEFEAEECLHLVTPDSGYGWRDGTTQQIYGWIVGEKHRYDESWSSAGVYSTGVRRFRSIFEIFGATKTSSHKKKKMKGKRVDRYNKQNGKKKKRKRY